MLYKHHDGIHWLEFELLADCPITHACLMRHGGESKGHLASLNLGKHVGDCPKAVQSNFKKVMDVLSLSKVASAKIAHEATVSEICSTEVPISDGLMTQVEDLAISVSQADCQAAIFYDPINHALANVHCGWRSNVVNIYDATVKNMQKVYGSHPSNLLVCISPSLGPESAEFTNHRHELPQSFWDFQIEPLYFDLWAISEWQLKQAGVLPHHMQIARIDTYSSNDYFSFRRSRSDGRQATICSLRRKA